MKETISFKLSIKHLQIHDLLELYWICKNACVDMYFCYSAKTLKITSIPEMISSILTLNVTEWLVVCEGERTAEIEKKWLKTRPHLSLASL